MNIKILQIKENKEKFLFMPWHRVRDCFDLNNYKEVWDCTFEDLGVTTPSTNVIWNLEKIWEIFNINHPQNYHGHSLSISDIVKLDDKYYFCDSHGWVDIKKELAENE